MQVLLITYEIGYSMMWIELHRNLFQLFLGSWQVENVKQRCLPNALNYPMLEEYDFRNDTVCNTFLLLSTSVLIQVVFIT